MSEIVWGEPIPVEGKRPEWLRDDERILMLDRSLEGGDNDDGWYGERIVYFYGRDIGRDEIAIRLPADHFYYASNTQRRDTDSVVADPEIERMMADAANGFTTLVSDDWQPDERTVRHVMALLKQHAITNTLACKQVEALLPKPDPAKALAEEWEKTSDWPDMGVHIAVEEYTRWLIDTGRIKE